MSRIKEILKKYDLIVTLVPLVILAVVVTSLFVSPDATGSVISYVRNFLGNQIGSFYIIVGIAFILISLFLAFSKYGKITLGKVDKPEHSTISWAFMIFTSTMAADVLYYSLHEWVFYYNSVPLDFKEMSVSDKVLWSETYSMFHWGFTPWIFYILPAVAYAYMIHVKGRDRQKISEACRPILGKLVDGFVGKVIDVVSVVSLLFATCTTFSLATPLLSQSLSELFGVNNSEILTILVLVVITVVYTTAVIVGFKGISKVSSLCIVFFFTLLALFFFNGNARFIVENFISSLGNLFQNFIRMMSWTDPLRVSGNGVSGFPQDWTIFYWSYWIAWSVATPFFIAKISKGRTVRSVILGGTLSGVACTFLSFSVLGGHGIAEQSKGSIQVAEMIAGGESPSVVIIEIIKTLYPYKLILAVLVLAMIGFYASTFDALTHVISSYSYKSIGPNEEPSKSVKIYWSILFAVLPCVLLFFESTMFQIQGLSIIAAFPMSILMIIVVSGFIKQIRKSSN